MLIFVGFLNLRSFLLSLFSDRSRAIFNGTLKTRVYLEILLHAESQMQVKSQANNIKN